MPDPIPLYIPDTRARLEYISYAEFLRRMKEQWKPGQHVSLVAPTGGGKTFVARDLVVIRKWSVVIATKGKDKSLGLYETENDFIYYDTWPPYYKDRHVLLWKRPAQLGDFLPQARLIYRMMNDVYMVGAWCVYFDDLFYVSTTLGLKSAVQMFYTQVRSNDVSIVAGMQRPSWVPLEAVSQATYLLVWRIRSKMDLERIAEGMGLDKDELRYANGLLSPYEFLLLENGQEPIRVQKRGMY